MKTLITHNRPLFIAVITLIFLSLYQNCGSPVESGSVDSGHISDKSKSDDVSLIDPIQSLNNDAILLGESSSAENDLRLCQRQVKSLAVNLSKVVLISRDEEIEIARNVGLVNLSEYLKRITIQANKSLHIDKIRLELADVNIILADEMGDLHRLRNSISADKIELSINRELLSGDNFIALSLSIEKLFLFSDNRCRIQPQVERAEIGRE